MRFAPLLVIAGASWAVVGIWGAITVLAIAAALIVAASNRRQAVRV